MRIAYALFRNTPNPSNSAAAANSSNAVPIHNPIYSSSVDIAVTGNPPIQRVTVVT